MIYQMCGHYIKNMLFQNMTRKTPKSKPRELVLSSAERPRFGIDIINREPIVNGAKKGKIIIRPQG